MKGFSWMPMTFFLILALASAIEASSVSVNGGAKYRPTGGEGSLRLEECPNACEFRCSETSHKNPCIFFCNYCCQRCLCVPSGTYGNKEECPCYNNIKTNEGKPKCP